MTQFTSLELVDVLIGRVRGTEFENLARDVRSAITAERALGLEAGIDPVRAASEIAAKICGLPPDADISRPFLRRGTHLPLRRARQLAMYLLYFGGRLSTTQIAKSFGLRDHTSAMYGRDRTFERMQTEPAFRERVIAAVDEMKKIERYVLEEQAS